MSIYNHSEELYFHERYTYQQERFPDVSNIFEGFYEKFITVYDESRKKINKLKTKEEVVLFSIIYNISSSTASLIKTFLIDFRSLSEPLLLRNIIESILIFNHIWFHNNRERLITLFYYHHIVLEHTFMNHFKVNVFGEDINTKDKNKYNEAMQIFSHLNDVTIEEANDIYPRRLGWAYNSIDGKTSCKIKDLFKRYNSSLVKKLYEDNVLNSIIHLRNFDLNYKDFNMYEFLELVELELDRVCKLSGIKHKIKGMKQLVSDYSENSYLKNIQPFYRPLYKRLGMKKQYKKQRQKMRKSNDLYLFFQPKSRFDFETKAYAAGYTKVIETKALMLYFISEKSFKLFNHIDKKHILKINRIILDMESDLAFGFHNEFKLKYRYLVEYLIYVYLGVKTDRDFEKFIYQIFTDLFNEVEAKLHFSLYHESCNFVHPNVYGFFGQYSSEDEYAFQYKYSCDAILDRIYHKMLKGIPLSTETYDFYKTRFDEYTDLLNSLFKDARKYNLSI